MISKITHQVALEAKTTTNPPFYLFLVEQDDEGSLGYILHR